MFTGPAKSIKLATSSLQNRRFDSEVIYIPYILRWLNRPYFSSIPSSVGLCLFLNSPPNSVQLVWLIFNNDRPFEPEIIMRNKGLIYVLTLIFSNSVYAREKWFKKTKSLHQTPTGVAQGCSGQGVACTCRLTRFDVRRSCVLFLYCTVLYSVTEFSGGLLSQM